MSLFFLPLAIVVVLLVALLALGASLLRALRAFFALKRVDLEVTPNAAKPGEGLRVFARVVPRGSSPVFVQATLTCTMFDHRPRQLYANVHNLTEVYGRPNEYAAYVRLPDYALRSGVVGDELSKLFSEDAHRLLVSWSVDLEVRSGSNVDVVLDRASFAVDVPEGRALQADRAYMDRILVETCGSMHSDLVFNWLVRLAAADGQIDPSEYELLRQVLRASHGVSDPAAQEQRIAVELQRDLQVDPVILRRNLAPETRAAFYRFLYAMAWRDGSLDGREHNFLMDALDKFGLDRAAAGEIEREILQGMASHAIH